MTDKSSVDFLRWLELASPIKIAKILNENGSQFADRFAMNDKKPSGQHAFDKACAGLAIEHRLAPPRHPQTNGMVARFNGRIREPLQQMRLEFSYQCALRMIVIELEVVEQGHLQLRPAIWPIQALKEWQQQKPELFVKRGYDQAGLDT
jgi:transposase InsO family protein